MLTNELYCKVLPLLLFFDPCTNNNAEIIYLCC